jgi:hypothetical protein
MTTREFWQKEAAFIADKSVILDTSHLLQIKTNGIISVEGIDNQSLQEWVTNELSE